MKATAKRIPPCQRTMNRVAQYVHVATPNRSTYTGGPPQFGQLSAMGPWVPAGTIGPWMGGGGGRFDRRRAPVAARTANTMMMRNTMHSGAMNANMKELPPKGNARATITKPKRTINPTTTPMITRTWFPGARRGGAQYGCGPYGGDPDGAAGGGGGGGGAGGRGPRGWGGVR